MSLLLLFEYLNYSFHIFYAGNKIQTKSVYRFFAHAYRNTHDESSQNVKYAGFK